MPRSGRKYLLTAPCRGVCPTYQCVFTCSRHTAVTIREEKRRSGRTVTRGPDESLCCRHRAVRVARAAKACSRADGTMPSPSVRRYRGPDELLPEVRTKVFVDGTVPWDAPELPRRVHVLAAYCRHHPRHETRRSEGSHFPRSGRQHLRTAPCRGVRPSYQGVFTCSRHTAVPTCEETRRSGRNDMPTSGRQHLRTAPCRGVRPSYQGVFTCSRHTAVPTCEETRRSGRNDMPTSGRQHLRTAPCRGMRPSYQGVFTCSRHTAFPIRDTRQGGPEEAIFRGPDESICALHRAVGCAGAAKACSRADGTMPSPSVRRHRGPDELLPKVRTQVFVDVTVQWDAHELQRRVFVLTATCRHHP